MYYGIKASKLLDDFPACIIKMDDWAASGLRVVDITRIRIIGKKGECEDSKEICVRGKGRQWKGEV